MIRQYTATIEGTSPLLMHWDNIEWADYMDEWKNNPDNKKVSKAGDDRTPAWRWIGHVYNDGKRLCLPQDNVSRCLMEAGALVPTGKGQKTFKAQTQSGMKIDEMNVPLLVEGHEIPWKGVAELEKDNSFSSHMQTVKKLGFVLFVKRAKVGNSKHIRVRPKFDSWALTFTVSVWDEAITEKVLQTVIELAGQYKGLCDWRPSSRTPGSYGMFRLVSLQQV